jgi:predicted transcriptional regulator
MLGIRLSPEAEEALERHARALGRGKSVIAREWIMERLERESIDAQLRRASRLLSQADARNPDHDPAIEEARLTDWLRALDEEDGGYDWGPTGPPA